MQKPRFPDLPAIRLLPNGELRYQELWPQDVVRHAVFAAARRLRREKKSRANQSRASLT
jgi:hypothetical protein